MNRHRPWILAGAVACLPLVLTLIGALTAPPGAAQETGGEAGRPALVAALLVSAALGGLFGWLVLRAPQVGLFRTRSMRFKRRLVAVGAVLTSSVFWMNVVVGDLAWRSILGRGAPGAGALSLPLWAYGLMDLGLAAGIYALARPGRRRPA